MTSPSPTSAGVSRRVALGATGAGVLAALTACASDIRPTAEGSASSSASAGASESASAAASSDKSYKGFVKFDNFEKNGEYVPATAEKKAQNVPKPLAPANMNEDNVDGMYAFIGYWLASFNYALMTGDTEPMKKADPADVYAKSLQELTIMYENDLGWMYGTDTAVTLELLSDAPQKISGSRTRYDWLAYMKYNPDMKIHTEGRPDEPFMEDSSRDLTRVGVEYKDGKWIMVSSEDGSSLAGSGGGSSSV